MRSVIILAAALTACGVLAQTGPEDDPTVHCYNALPTTHPELAPLERHIVVLTGPPTGATWEQLSSTARPSEEEKRLLGIYGRARQLCDEAGRAHRARYAPPAWRAAMERGYATTLALVARLYGGEITYGEYIRARRENSDRVFAETSAAHTDLMRSEQQQRAQSADAMRDALLIQQMLRPAAPRPVYTPPRAVNCTSTRIGSTVSTNCF